MTVKSVRIGLWAIVIALCLGMAIWYFLPRPSAEGGFGGGNYALVDENDRPVTQTMLVGQPSLLFFGYTHCPDVCPTTLSEMASWLQQLGPDGKALKAFFVTVDPERDTPEVMKGYVTALSDRITGVTGTRLEIDRIIAAWHVYAKKVPATGDDYSMDHTATVFLLDAKGQFQGTIAYGEDTGTTLQKLKRLVSSS